MDEESKIKELLKQYHQFFETTTADVAWSMKGKRFFYMADSRSKELNSFREYESAEELEKMILHEMVHNLNTAIEVGIENLNIALNEHSIPYSHCEYGNAINHLANSLDIIWQEYNRWHLEIQTSLNGLMEYADRHKGKSCD